MSARREPRPDNLVALLAASGFIAAEAEAELLRSCAAGDGALLDRLVARRLTGEPLAWIIGTVQFCGLAIRVAPGVYVPRFQTELLVQRAVECLPSSGVAVDICTGTGAIAKVLTASRPRARVVASDIDPGSVACAIENGVEAYLGDLFGPLPSALRGMTDVVIGVVPYVPTLDLPLLQRDTFTFETPLAYDGGRDGTNILRRVLSEGRRFLRSGGTLLLELGGSQAELLGNDLARLGYVDVRSLADEDGDVRGIEAIASSSAAEISQTEYRQR